MQRSRHCIKRNRHYIDEEVGNVGGEIDIVSKDDISRAPTLCAPELSVPLAYAACESLKLIVSEEEMYKSLSVD